MSDNFKFAQLQNFTLAGSGAVIGATSIILTSFQDIDGNDLAMTDFGDKGFMTLQPGEGQYEEQVSFTGVVQNANGTATLTGVSNVAFLEPYTETSGLAKTHAGGTRAIVSNTSGFYSQFAAKNNDETIAGSWTFDQVPSSAPAPVSGGDLANKDYVLSVVSGGTTTLDKLVEVGVAGETVSAGQVVYMKAADGRWWKATGSDATTLNTVQLGIAQGAGTAGNNIANGVLRRGMDTNQTGGVAGSVGYVSNTSTVSTSAGTTERAIGNFKTANNFIFDPFFYYLPSAATKAALTGDTGTPSSSNKFVTQESTSFRFGGTGADGALSISSGTTTIDVGGAAVFTKNYSSISITGTGALAFTNPHANGTIVILKSRGNVTITSSATPAVDLRNMGSSVSSRVGLQPTGLVFTDSNYVGGTASSTSGDIQGGSVFSFRNFYTLSADSLISKSIYVACGAAGGGASNTGSSTGGTGGRGGGALYLECRGALNITSTINSSGANGAASTTPSAGQYSAGAGGGGSAGMVVILYNTLTANSATITATGGTGGTAANGSGSTGTLGTGGGGAGSLYAAGGGCVRFSGGAGTAAAGIGAGGGGGCGSSSTGGAGGSGGASMGGLITLNTVFS